MLASVGWVWPQLFGLWKGGPVTTTDPIEALQQVPTVAWVQIIAFCGAIEANRVNYDKGLERDSSKPFDPLGLYPEDAEGQLKMQPRTQTAHGDDLLRGPLRQPLRARPRPQRFPLGATAPGHAADERRPRTTISTAWWHVVRLLRRAGESGGGLDPVVLGGGVKAPCSSGAGPLRRGRSGARRGRGLRLLCSGAAASLLGCAGRGLLCFGGGRLVGSRVFFRSRGSSARAVAGAAPSVGASSSSSLRGTSTRTSSASSLVGGASAARSGCMGLLEKRRSCPGASAS